VIVPTFNQAGFIERTINSILNQNYLNLELIIIDGGSTDGTLGRLEEYKAHIAYLHSGPDKGQSDALNHGFRRATGDILAWMNSDDLYLPGAFSAAVDTLETRPGAQVAFGDWWSIDADDRVIAKDFAFDFSLSQFIYEGFHLNSQAMFWRRSAHQRFGDFDVLLQRTMDYDLILRLGRNEGQQSFARVPAPLACFRRHSAQKTQGYDEQVAREHRAIAAKNQLRWKFTPPGDIVRNTLRARRAWWYLKRGGLDYLVDKLQSKDAR
jgi:glycosyltransferase involved in cell wall biosynthesis